MSRQMRFTSTTVIKVMIEPTRFSRRPCKVSLQPQSAPSHVGGKLDPGTTTASTSAVVQPVLTVTVTVHGINESVLQNVTDVLVNVIGLCREHRSWCSHCDLPPPHV